MELADNVGVTALMFAVGIGHEGTVRVLLAAGAAVDVKDNIGVDALTAAIGSDNLDVVRLLLEAGAEPPPPTKLPPRIPGHVLNPTVAKMQRLLGLHRGRRQALVAVQERAGMEAAEAAAAAVADALLAEEEADKSLAESRQAKAKRKKQRQKDKRAEVVPGPAQAAGAGSGPTLSGADPPSQCSDSQAASAEANRDVRRGRGGAQGCRGGGAKCG